jgi:cell wall-associated NlpC family hydrolase
MQQAELGEELAIARDLDGLMRGDLIFWKGHVGIMLDGFLMLHANAYHMGVAAELVASAVDRIAAAGSTIAAVRRLPRRSAATTAPEPGV